MLPHTLLLLLAGFGPLLVSGLSCTCGISPCQTPSCCDSGYYTLDECGCCLTCAKAEDDTCGGPFRISGQCATGTRCLRQCECRTVSNNECVFPFKYKGVSYNSCTKAESSNGAAWCATGVDNEGEAVNGAWEDCEEGCPGTSFTCNEGFLFNIEGRCVNATEAPGLLRSLQEGPLAASLDDIPSAQSQRPAPVCETPGRTSGSGQGCRCSTEATVKGVDGNFRGGCIPPRDDAPIQELENGWCFLENVIDPSNPTQDCYEDTQWSEVDGRFWSNQACYEEKNAPPLPCMSTLNNLCIFPFTYQNTTHHQCTHVTSENGAAWCATQVDDNGVVVTNKWEDCQAHCPVELQEE